MGTACASKFSSLWRQRHQSGAAVSRGDRNVDQPAALQGLQRGRQGGAIHCEQGSHCRHTGWFRAVQGHHQRELPVCQAQRAERVIEAPCQGPCGSLQMKTEASVANQERGLKRRVRSS